MIEIFLIFRLTRPRFSGTLYFLLSSNNSILEGNMKTGKNLYYSISKKLQKDKKINDEFEVMINSLTLEEVIALKLELSTRSLRGKFYGFPVWKSLPELTRDAVLKYALSATRSKKEAARFLGITVSELNKNLNQYNTESFFVNGDGT